MDVLNQFWLSVLIEHLADIEGVATEIRWLQEIRQEEALEAAHSR